MKEKIVVSFSGGETSGMMCKWLIDNHSNDYDFKFVFANTGKEHDETLIFVDKCDKYFNLHLTWIEAVINPVSGNGGTYKTVNFRSADRVGKPFEDFIKKEGIPNTSRQHCTSRLKTRPIRKWMKAHDLIKCKTAIGMRADEPKRSDPESKSAIEFNLIYPLAHWGDIDKQDVNTFWENQPFRLNILSLYGNCLTCFKKSDNKLYRIMHEHPEWFEWNSRMETQYGHVKAGENDRHVFFRKKRDTNSIVCAATLADYDRLVYLTTSDRDKSSGCGESCEPFQTTV